MFPTFKRYEDSLQELVDKMAAEQQATPVEATALHLACALAGVFTFIRCRKIFVNKTLKDSQVHFCSLRG